jgi:hypothetical protein
VIESSAFDSPLSTRYTRFRILGQNNIAFDRLAAHIAYIYCMGADSFDSDLKHLTEEDKHRVLKFVLNRICPKKIVI